MLLRAGWGCSVEQARRSLLSLVGAAMGHVTTSTFHGGTVLGHGRKAAEDQLEALLTPNYREAGTAEAVTQTVAIFRRAIQTDGAWAARLTDWPIQQCHA